MLNEIAKILPFSVHVVRLIMAWSMLYATQAGIRFKVDGRVVVE